jgi:hypothetical protein
MHLCACNNLAEADMAESAEIQLSAPADSSRGRARPDKRKTGIRATEKDATVQFNPEGLCQAPRPSAGLPNTARTRWERMAVVADADWIKHVGVN